MQQSVPDTTMGHRLGDAVLQVSDQTGQPLGDTEVEVRQPERLPGRDLEGDRVDGAELV